MNTQISSVRSGFDDYLFDFIRLVDALVFIFVASCAYFALYGTFVMPGNYYSTMFFGIALYLFIGYNNGLYKYKCFRSVTKQISSLFMTIGLTFTIVVTAIFYLQSEIPFSKHWMAFWFGFSSFTLLSFRLLFIPLFKKSLTSGRFVRKVVLFGESDRAKMLLEKMRVKGADHVQPLAIFIEKEGDKSRTSFHNLRVIQDFKEFKRFCLAEKVDDVIVTYDLSTRDDAETLINRLRTLPCNVRYCLSKVFFGRAVLDDSVWGAPILTIYHRSMVGRRLVLKRLEDLFIGFIACLFALPVMIVIALALFVSGERSIIFRQERRGFYGEKFEIYKFRTMRQHEVKTGDFVQQATKDDPRITRVGAILRKTSLDEIPQIFNVLEGSMSLVGPRPHAISHDDHYDQLINLYAARHHMKPGITGWAQVNGWRGETDTLLKMQKRVEHDIYYIENWSLWFDIKIMFLTAFAPFHKNAY